MGRGSEYEMLSDQQVEALTIYALLRLDEQMGEYGEDALTLNDEVVDVPPFHCETFKETGVMSNNHGFTLRFEGKSGQTLGEYQVSIVRSA